MQSVLQSTTGIGPTPQHPENLDGKVAIVTGGAFGIGYEISRALAHGGCKVIMINRKEEQGQEALDQIRKETPSADVAWKECDMGHLADIKEVFSKLRDSQDRLDYLVLSAGVNTNQYGLDADGIDRHFGVNFLGQYYAVNQLWPLLRKTSKKPGVDAPRVVFEASEMHRFAPKETQFATPEEINNEKIDPTQLYSRTKLAMILFAKYGLAEKVIKNNHDNIYALSVHPGAVSHPSARSTSCHVGR
jgi:NAD(P)-dependent dehydrogenase (short-subunit alcohol dehydrogenase family)